MIILLITDRIAVSLLFLSNVKAEDDAGATESSIEFQSLPYGSYPDLNIMDLEVNNQGKRKFLQGAQLANSGPTPTVNVDASLNNEAPPPAEVDNLEDNFLYANLPYNENTGKPC